MRDSTLYHDADAPADATPADATPADATPPSTDFVDRLWIIYRHDQRYDTSDDVHIFEAENTWELCAKLIAHDRSKTDQFKELFPPDMHDEWLTTEHDTDEMIECPEFMIYTYDTMPPCDDANKLEYIKKILINAYRDADGCDVKKLSEYLREYTR